MLTVKVLRYVAMNVEQIYQRSRSHCKKKKEDKIHRSVQKCSLENVIEIDNNSLRIIRLIALHER